MKFILFSVALALFCGSFSGCASPRKMDIRSNTDNLLQEAAQSAK